MDLEGDQNVDYIYCLGYSGDHAVPNNFQPLEVNETTVECNLSQRQRSSQQILDLADYLYMHNISSPPMRRYHSYSSFSSDIPLWIELADPKSFFGYIKEKFEGEDVMLIFKKPSNFNGIEAFCKKQKWRCTEWYNVKGSEASVTILYDYDGFDYECFTRAKTQLVIVTVHGHRSYISNILQDIDKGTHNDKLCECYRNKYQNRYGQELPDDEFKGNKSKIQNLIRKVHVTEESVILNLTAELASARRYSMELLAENKELRKKLDEANKRLSVPDCHDQ